MTRYLSFAFSGRTDVYLISCFSGLDIINHIANLNILTHFNLFIGGFLFGFLILLSPLLSDEAFSDDPHAANARAKPKDMNKTNHFFKLIPQFI